MVAESLVDSLIDDGGKLINRMKKDGIVVTVAAWIKAEESNRWMLYISSPIVDEMGPIASYRLVQDTLRSLGLIEITTTDVVLIGKSHSITKLILSMPRNRTSINMDLMYVYHLDSATFAFTGVPMIAALDNRPIIRTDSDLIITQSN